MITPFNWRVELENLEMDSLGDDFVLFDYPFFYSALDYPFKLDVTVAIICNRGTMSGTINLKQYEIKSPGLAVMISGQILQFETISEDFSGHFIVMSNRFTDSLFSSIQERFPLFLSVYENPWMPMKEEELESLDEYYSMMQKTLKKSDNPHRVEIVKHLTQAFFYGTGYRYHQIPGFDKRSKQEILTDKFLSLVQANFRKQRSLEYYAETLRLTPKYLSKVIRETSGNSASEWINNYVILEARALLKSTNITIQQISDDLYFPSQSFFGKYFKRHVGISPKEYRKV